MSRRGNDVVHLLVDVKVKRLERVKQKVAEVFVEIGVEDASIERVRHASAVHCLADEISQRAPRQDVVSVVVRLGEVGVDEEMRDSEIRLVEVVRNVPPKFAVLASLLDDGMKERQDVRQGTVALVWAVREGLLGDLCVRGAHVELQSVGRLGDHLERTLEDAQGELVRRVGCEPEPEVLRRLGDLLEDLLERLEPAG